MKGFFIGFIFVKYSRSVYGGQHPLFSDCD
nr:MAG TPA: hypothetical protein [Caudoviricetes sp.]